MFSYSKLVYFPKISTFRESQLLLKAKAVGVIKMSQKNLV